ncbi:hypothetical protein C8F01DRAFT_1351646 [Mycena amicta]|nr:hypothetical protein C8F01DRAFT_1303947 [Mycena amicta]KAJ7065661.1 hypothetical protein C8F01DRAFT_1351646 [Mycena amicta]
MALNALIPAHALRNNYPPAVPILDRFDLDQVSPRGRPASDKDVVRLVNRPIHLITGSMRCTHCRDLRLRCFFLSLGSRCYNCRLAHHHDCSFSRRQTVLDVLLSWLPEFLDAELAALDGCIARGWIAATARDAAFILSIDDFYSIAQGVLDVVDSNRATTRERPTDLFPPLMLPQIPTRFSLVLNHQGQRQLASVSAQAVALEHAVVLEVIRTPFHDADTVCPSGPIGHRIVFSEHGVFCGWCCFDGQRDCVFANPAALLRVLLSWHEAYLSSRHEDLWAAIIAGTVPESCFLSELESILAESYAIAQTIIERFNLNFHTSRLIAESFVESRKPDDIGCDTPMAESSEGTDPNSA